MKNPTCIMIMYSSKQRSVNRMFTSKNTSRWVKYAIPGRFVPRIMTHWDRNVVTINAIRAGTTDCANQKDENAMSTKKVLRIKYSVMNGAMFLLNDNTTLIT